MAKNFLSKAWENIAHGFSQYIDDRGQAVDGSFTQRLIDTPEFKAGATMTVLNSAMAFNFGGVIEAGVAFTLSSAGTAVHMLAARVLDNEIEIGPEIINKNPTRQEIWLYGDESAKKGQVRLERQQASVPDNALSIIPVLGGIFGAMTPGALYLLENADLTIPNTIMAYTVMGVSQYISAGIMSATGYLGGKRARYQHIASQDWVIQPAGTEKPKDLEKDQGLEGLVDESVLLPISVKA